MFGAAPEYERALVWTPADGLASAERYRQDNVRMLFTL
jgi:hypothetical protein